MKLLFIRPIITERADSLEEAILQEFASPHVTVVARHLQFGPASIENEYDLVYSAPFVLQEAIRGEQDGFDGIISYCFANPAVDACREAVRIPVLGSGEAAISLAAAIGRRIGIVTILPNIVPLLKKQNLEYMMNGKLVSVRNANIPVTDIGNGSETILEKIYQEAYRCVTEDNTDVIVLGCTGFAGFAKRIASRLEEDGYIVPVIDPAAASLKMMEALITCNVKNSNLTYMDYIKKERKFPGMQKG